MNELLPLPLVAFTALVFAAAGFVKGVIGLGLPTLTMGLLGLVMLPAQAAALLVLPSLLTNVWQVVGRGLPALARRLATLLLGVCAGVALGAGWLAGDSAVDARWAGVALGAALAVYAALGLLAWRPRVAPRHEVWLAPLVGLATGLVTAATGVFVFPAVPYLQALDLTRDELVQALGLAFLVATLALAVSLGHSGALRVPELLASLHAVVPALLGMGLGQWLRGQLAPALFRRCFLVGLLLLGGWLVLRGVVQL